MQTKRKKKNKYNKQSFGVENGIDSVYWWSEKANVFSCEFLVKWWLQSNGVIEEQGIKDTPDWILSEIVASKEIK